MLLKANFNYKVCQTYTKTTIINTRSPFNVSTTIKALMVGTVFGVASVVDEIVIVLDALKYIKAMWFRLLTLNSLCLSTI